MREAPIRCETCQQEYRFDSDLLYGRTVQTCACGSGPMAIAPPEVERPKVVSVPFVRQKITIRCSECPTIFTYELHRVHRKTCSQKCAWRRSHRQRSKRPSRATKSVPLYVKRRSA